MSTNPQRLQYLFRQYLRDTGTPGELKEFWEGFAALEEDDPLKEELWQLWQDVSRDKNRNWDHASQRIRMQVSAGKASPFFTKRRLVRAAAAVLIFLAGAGISYILFHQPPPPMAQAPALPEPIKQDIAPGGNKATLTLAGGETIVLDSAQEGMLVRQGNTKILKQRNGRLAYKTDNTPAGGPAPLNTLRVPRGGQYQLILPDGSKVWLNSASSIRFPAAFNEQAREVEITGEAYFEVTHLTASSVYNIKKGENIPFIVKANGVKVEVLGTHFNINAYKDEGAIKTTLLEGRVKVMQGMQQQLLMPGQQALVKDQGIALVDKPDLDGVMAWKNGYFQFQNDSISSIMRQVARWYDVDITYKGNISQLFIGKVPRNVNVSTLLKILESTGWAHFKINGREITVEP
jgi:ferric-dicitrate binding protein FerR (iron transport regulator)